MFVLPTCPQAEIGDHIWHPVRRALGATGFGVGAYSAARAGDVLVGTHDETGLGSNRHEELYVVLRGRALFEVDGKELELGPEELLLVDPATRRGARALADGTSVLVIGGAPGAVAPAPYEHWYMALTADDPRAAAEIAAEGLAQFPDHGQLNYQLACFRALAGELDVAARHLRRAVATDERAWDWLEDDADLDALRAVPGAVPTRARVGPIHVERAGTGASVVLIHAGIADRRMWDREWVEWASTLDVIRLDLRGFGLSEPQTGSFSQAADVLAVLDDLGVERAILLGASYGGRVAIDLAASHPDRVVGLVLAGAGLPDHQWSAEIEAFGAAEDEALEAGDLDRATEVNIDFWLPRASEAVREAVRVQQRRAFDLDVDVDGDEAPLTDDLTSRLSAVDVPALVLTGQDDYADFQTIADHLAATLPKARRETIPGAGHVPSLEQPAAFDAVVLPFMAGVS